MIDVNEALRLIGDRARSKNPITLPLDSAVGHALAETIVSDTNTPPFDRAMMDGYAVRSSEITADGMTFDVAATVAAGDPNPTPLPRGSAVKIMTGAAVPDGADAVIARERTTESAHAVTIQQFPVSAELNVMRAGQICRRGDSILSAGHLLTPVELGVLAETGYDSVSVIPPATVAVLATGSELVPIGQPLSAGQIRNSNGTMLAAAASACGCDVVDLGIGRDDRDALKALVGRGLESDVLLLSGGVSAGDFDLVPAVLTELGVDQVFHKVKLKPGKPIWFGESASGTLVFGLPGNPVSSLVCFRLFVQPALQRIAGRVTESETNATAELQNEYRQPGDRTTYYPAVVRNAGSASTIELLPWLGSADLHTFTRANSLAIFPADQTKFAVGDRLEYLTI